MKPCSKTRWSQGEQEGRCEMTKSQKSNPDRKRRDYIPVTVPFAATPTGETPGIDQWAHRAVWTDRMLATLLENKVKGGKWHTLIDKVFGELNLFCSARKVLGKKGAAGVDRQTVEDFAEHEREELRRLHEELRKAVATVRIPCVRTWIPKARAVRRSGRWEFRRCGTASCKRHWST